MPILMILFVSPLYYYKALNSLIQSKTSITFYLFLVASAWVVLWSTLDTRHPTSNSSMRVSGTICLDLKTGSWTGEAVTWLCLLITIIFACQHQPPPRATRQTMRMVQPGFLPSQLDLPIPLRRRGKPAPTSPL